MKFFLSFLIALLLSLGATDAQLMNGPSYGGGVGWNGVYTMSVSPTSYTYTVGASGTVVGTAVASVSPQPLGAVTYSLSGANAADFTINSSTGVITTNGSTPSCTTTTGVNVVATQSGVSNSPVTQAITVSCNAAFANYQVNSETIGAGGNGDSGSAFVLGPVDVKDTNSTAVLFVTYLRSVTTLTGSSITDTFGVTWGNPVCTVDANNGTTSYKTSMFVQNLGSHSGQDTISVAVGATNIQPFQYQVFVEENLANPAADGSLCPSSGVTPTAAGLIEPGTFTPTTTNTQHLIINYTALNVCCSNAAVPTKWTPASGFALTASAILQQYVNNTMFPWAGEQIYTPSQSVNSAIDPSITATGETASTGDNFNTLTVALAVQNNSNTPATTLHVQKITQETVNNWATFTTVKMQASFIGNARVLTNKFSVCASGCDWVNPTVTDSCGTWTATSNSADSVIWTIDGCSPDPNDTITFSGSNNHAQYMWEIWDITNETAIKNSATGNNGGSACGTTTNNAPSITPSVSAGVTIAQFDNGLGPTTGYASGAPANALWDDMKYTGQSDGSWVTQGGALSHLYFTSNAAQTWNYTLNSAQDCLYTAIVIQ